MREALARTEREKLELADRLKPALDIEAEIASLHTALEKERLEAEQQSARIKAESDQLRERYARGLKTYETLEAEVRKLEEDLEDIAYGLYKPHFTYSDTEAYKAAIQNIREGQKSMIRSGQAATCGTGWTVNGNKREGERMVKAIPEAHPSRVQCGVRGGNCQRRLEQLPGDAGTHREYVRRAQ